MMPRPSADGIGGGSAFGSTVAMGSEPTTRHASFAYPAATAAAVAAWAAEDAGGTGSAPPSPRSGQAQPAAAAAQDAAAEASDDEASEGDWEEPAAAAEPEKEAAPAPAAADEEGTEEEEELPAEGSWDEAAAAAEAQKAQDAAWQAPVTSFVVASRPLFASADGQLPVLRPRRCIAGLHLSPLQLQQCTLLPPPLTPRR